MPVNLRLVTITIYRTADGNTSKVNFLGIKELLDLAAIDEKSTYDLKFLTAGMKALLPHLLLQYIAQTIINFDIPAYLRVRS